MYERSRVTLRRHRAGRALGAAVQACGTKPNEPRRTIKSIKHLPEVSLVTFPMNELARTSTVKAAAQINTIREFEDFLRDVGGFSHAAAKAIAARGFKSSEPRDEDGAIKLLEAVKRLRAVSQLSS
jgi:uncharacterized protein